MRKFLAVPFEALQVLGMALFFGIALVLTVLTAPGWLAKLGHISPESAARYFTDITSLIGRNGLWIVLAALVGGIIAPYARADGKKMLAWIRVVCVAAAAVIVLLTWGGFESLPRVLPAEAEGGKHAADAMPWRSDKKPTPWNGLLVATGMNLLLGAFQITGGAGKKPAGGGGGGK
jgi:hypothetical protein